MQADPATQDFKNILVRSVNWLGDAVMTTPALLRLRERFPDSRITLLCQEKLSELWWRFPAVDEVLAFEKTDSLSTIGATLRRHRFDCGILFPNSHRSALELFIARIPCRMGLGGGLRGLLLTHSIQANPVHVPMRKSTRGQARRRLDGRLPRQTFPAGAHHVHQYLHIVAATGANREPVAPRLTVTDEEMKGFEHRHLPAERVGGARPIVAVCPGAEYGPAKRWPIDRYAEAIQLAAGKQDLFWLLLGGPGDVSAAADLEHQLDASGIKTKLNLAGKTSIRELMCGLKRSSALVANDSGPMHLAAALGIPTVIPFGSTSAELTGPGLPGDSRHHALIATSACSPCFLRECPLDFQCMLSIPAARVAERLLEAVRR